MSHMFKVLLNPESQEGGVGVWGFRRRVRPALEDRCIVAFRHVWRPKKEGRLPSRAGEGGGAGGLPAPCRAL